ncbi:tRNA pseudouridine(13) synthase TruD [Desulfosarcina sp. OttesenSCG-928-G10]|nr:tRNA pseudouridine(13) synthase TruD [Desulfosarcina sp. OttesenSCG-928-G10]
MHPDRFSGLSTRQTDMAMAELAFLPLISAEFPGIGGIIKKVPDHFKVEERLPYGACGEGEHVYITFRRSGWNTVDAARAMQKALNVSPSDVGWGGRKDKTAVVTQTFSFRLGVHAALAEVRARLSGLPFEILEINRHLNKIKTGHVAANRFTILVCQPVSDAFSKAQTIARHLSRTGIPNFYGPQRFGHQFQNVEKGFSLMRPDRKIRKDDFLVSVVQSALFNIWLKNRMETGNYHRLLAGDIVRKTDTGGMFDVLDPVVEGERFERREIIYTGPMYGFKMKPAQADAGARETELLNRFGFTLDDFRRFRAPGSRREAILFLSDLEIRPVEENLEFSFTLPSGAYATTVLREFMHVTDDQGACRDPVFI